MRNIIKFFNKYILINTIFIVGMASAILSTDTPRIAHKSHVTPSPWSEKLSRYEGGALAEEIKGIKVSSCISLGDGCVDKVNHILKEADQFIVSFMYRFNSPSLLKTLKDKHIKGVPTITFLDYNQTYESSSEGSNYPRYVQKLIESVPVSLVKLKNKPFHQKVTISKKMGEEAVVIVGSANATFEADNIHSEDVLFIQSNQLASFYLKNFHNLMRMLPKQLFSSKSDAISDPAVEIFHEHRLGPNRSNTDFLLDFEQGVQSRESTSILKDGYNGDIVAAGISKGSPNGECEKAVNNILRQHNEFLFLFENFISLDGDLTKEGAIGHNLINPTPKLIVLDKNKHNKKSQQFLSDAQDNDVILFKPFSGGKFHHKLIISYPQGNLPIVYTGSFHISKSSITRNSETIIGIRSPELADKYLAGILENSGLGDVSEVWEFISRYPQLVTTKKKGPHSALPKSSSKKKLDDSGFALTEVGKVAQKILANYENNMERYLDRFARVRGDLQEAISGPDSGDKQRTIGKYFDTLLSDFSKKDSLEKLSVMEDLEKYIFLGNRHGEEEVKDIFLKELKKNSAIIREKHTYIPPFPDYGDFLLENWLESTREWVEYAKRLQELDESEEDTKEQLASIETLCTALNDLNAYINSFKELARLHDILTKVFDK